MLAIRMLMYKVGETLQMPEKISGAQPPLIDRFRDFWHDFTVSGHFGCLLFEGGGGGDDVSPLNSTIFMHFPNVVKGKIHHNIRFAVT